MTEPPPGDISEKAVTPRLSLQAQVEGGATALIRNDSPAVDPTLVLVWVGDNAKVASSAVLELTSDVVDDVFNAACSRDEVRVEVYVTVGRQRDAFCVRQFALQHCWFPIKFQLEISANQINRIIRMHRGSLL